MENYRQLDNVAKLKTCLGFRLAKGIPDVTTLTSPMPNFSASIKDYHFSSTSSSKT